jgi:DNA/RNA-binding domain of Phe-tRNA-synthetase-like protein
MPLRLARYSVSWPRSAGRENLTLCRKLQESSFLARRSRLLPPVTTDFALAPELASIVRPGVIWWTGATVVLHEHRLDPLLAEAEAKVRISPPAESAAVRTMYKKVGIDPTKTRPSNEALLRRVRKGDPLPRINSLVDVCNWCSLEFQLPYGLYDVTALEPPVTLRMGHPGESYPGIRKDVVNVADRLTLADQGGPFGNPTSDSARTMVTEATTSVLAVVFAPAETAPARLATVLEATAARLTEFAGGRQTLRAVI